MSTSTSGKKYNTFDSRSDVEVVGVRQRSDSLISSGSLASQTESPSDSDSESEYPTDPRRSQCESDSDNENDNDNSSDHDDDSDAGSDLVAEISHNNGPGGPTAIANSKAQAQAEDLGTRGGERGTQLQVCGDPERRESESTTTARPCFNLPVWLLVVIVAGVALLIAGSGVGIGCALCSSQKNQDTSGHQKQVSGNQEEIDNEGTEGNENGEQTDDQKPNSGGAQMEEQDKKNKDEKADSKKKAEAELKRQQELKLKKQKELEKQKQKQKQKDAEKKAQEMKEKQQEDQLKKKQQQEDELEKQRQQKEKEQKEKEKLKKLQEEDDKKKQLELEQQEKADQKRKKDTELMGNLKNKLANLKTELNQKTTHSEDIKDQLMSAATKKADTETKLKDLPVRETDFKSQLAKLEVQLQIARNELKEEATQNNFIDVDKLPVDQKKFYDGEWEVQIMITEVAISDYDFEEFDEDSFKKYALKYLEDEIDDDVEFNKILDGAKKLLDQWILQIKDVLSPLKFPDLKKSIIDQEDKIDQIKDDETSFKQELAQSQNNIKDLKAKLKTDKDEIARLDKEIKQLQVQVDKLDASLKVVKK